MGLVFQIGGWVVWYVGGGRVLQALFAPDSATPLTLGTLLAFLGYLAMFYGPLQGLTNLTGWITQFSTQVQRIFEVLDTPIAISESAQRVALPTMGGKIEFRGVSFGYSRQSPVLKNASFQIDAGDTIGIVGRSGSGKTTIINLLSRFYDVDEGQILIDDIDIRNIALTDLRQQIGVVLQEPFLFRGTIWENMIYGRPEATAEQVITACRAANAHDFLLRQQHGYDTWVGERGAGLSGGERQRLSIARALLCEPRLLILDEATSSVDTESEQAIQRALEELVKGRTSIIIAHRLSTLRNCTRIIVIDEGRVAEQGTHRQLMQADGKYARFVKLQSTATQETSVDQLTHMDDEAEAVMGQVDGGELVVDPTTHLAPIGSHRPRWLEPEFAKIHLGNRNVLHVTVLNERIYHGVYAMRCMPVRHPTRYISLRYVDTEDRDQEVGLIRDLNQWPDTVQALIGENLLRRYFIHTIQRIHSMELSHNYLTVNAQTDLGPMEFIMRWSHDSAYDYGQHGKMLLDVEDSRYLIPNVSALAEADRRLFERYIYW